MMRCIITVIRVNDFVESKASLTEIDPFAGKTNFKELFYMFIDCTSEVQNHD